MSEREGVGGATEFGEEERKGVALESECSLPHGWEIVKADWQMLAAVCHCIMGSTSGRTAKARRPKCAGWQGPRLYSSQPLPNCQTAVWLEMSIGQDTQSKLARQLKQGTSRWLDPLGSSESR